MPVTVLIFQHFSRATRCALFCTAPISAIYQIFVKNVDDFLEQVSQKFGILLTFVIFRKDFDKRSRNFEKIRITHSQDSVFRKYSILRK